LRHTLDTIKKTKLTVKQQRFVDFYEGNATQAAIQAGYSEKTANVIGPENLAKPRIFDAIQNRLQKVDKPKIMSREDRQKFWSKVSHDDEQSMNDRLRASELLAKSQSDFLQRHEMEIKAHLHDEYEETTDEELINDLGEFGSRCHN